MKTAILMVCLFFVTAAAGGEDRVIGLLSLPEVFGTGACDRFVPDEIPLHTAPDGPIVGFIRIDTPWTLIRPADVAGRAFGGKGGLSSMGSQRLEHWDRLSAVERDRPPRVGPAAP
jgi:hypothetical protein